MSPSMDTNPNLIVPAGGGHIFVFGVHIYLSLAKSMVMHGPESRAKLWIYTYIDIYLFIYMYILTIWDSILDTHTRHRFTSVRISQRIGITNWSPVWPTVKEKLPGEHIFEWSFHTPFNQKSHVYKIYIYLENGFEQPWWSLRRCIEVPVPMNVHLDESFPTDLTDLELFRRFCLPIGDPWKDVPGIKCIFWQSGYPTNHTRIDFPQVRQLVSCGIALGLPMGCCGVFCPCKIYASA